MLKAVTIIFVFYQGKYYVTGMKLHPLSSLLSLYKHQKVGSTESLNKG